jgi:acetyltransferase-like isoleucine patch superfamily enzyme
MLIHFSERRRKWLALKLVRAVQSVRIAKYRLLSYLTIEGKPILNQPLHAVGTGTLHIDGAVVFGFFPSPSALSTYAYVEARNVGAHIRIGNGTVINNSFCAIAEFSHIEIGERCLIGSNVEIIDSDFHGLNISDRQQSQAVRCKPVVIENDVFIGSNVKILKGVHIGKGAVVANGAVVSRDVPSCVIAAGNPARSIRSLEEIT